MSLTDAFCRDHLNEEYAEYCRRLAQTLARKRPSPLLSGQPTSWACGIVRTIGRVNYLDDPSQTPHMKLTAIDKAFGVSQATGQAKSKAIHNLLKISPLEPTWTLPSRLEDNPLVWLLKVNGFVMDIRKPHEKPKKSPLRRASSRTSQRIESRTAATKTNRTLPHERANSHHAGREGEPRTDRGRAHPHPRRHQLPRPEGRSIAAQDACR